MSTTVETTTGIRPFQIEIADEELDDLRRRIAATRWPEKETVDDQSQGPRSRRCRRSRATGRGVRLAQVRGAAEGPSALHHRDRWAGHSFHSRSLGT